MNCIAVYYCITLSKVAQSARAAAKTVCVFHLMFRLA